MNDPRQVEVTVPNNTQTRHTKNIQAFRYNRTLFVADDRRNEAATVKTALFSSSSMAHFHLVNEQEIKPFSRLAWTKVSPGNSVRVELAWSPASSPFLAACKCARCNAAPAAAAPTCCYLVRVAPIHWLRAASNIHSPTTDNYRCSSGICDHSVIC